MAYFESILLQKSLINFEQKMSSVTSVTKNCYIQIKYFKNYIILFDVFSSYCSKEHQKKGWKAGHKANCKAYKIEIGKYGRQLVASRDLKPGSRILTKNKPSAVGPRQKKNRFLNMFNFCMHSPTIPTTIINLGGGHTEENVIF